MRRRIRFVCAAWLVAAAACSDDGLDVQDQNSSGTAADGAETTSIASGPPTSESASQGGSGTGDSGPFDESTQGDAGSSTGPLSPDSSGTVTGTTEGTTDEGTTGTTGGSTTEVCDPITDDPSGIGAMCRSDFDCLPGYTCQPFEGIVFQQTCQILCMQDCDCPMGYACIETVDKTGIPWFQCTP